MKAKSVSRTGLTRENKDIQNSERSVYLASLLDQISDALISTDMDFRVVEWNAAAENIYGWQSAEVFGHTAGEFLQTEYLECTRDEVIQTVVEKGVWKGEATQNRKNGERFPVMVSVSQVKNQTNEPIGFVTINRDITERKRAEQELKRWADVFQNVSFGFVVGDFESKTLGLMNPAFASMHGYTTDELIGAPIVSVFAPESRAELPKNIQLAHENGYHAWEANHIRKDGTIFPTLVDVVAVKDETGKMLYRIVSVQDISERKQAEKQILQMKRLYATLSQVNQTIVRVKDRADLYQSICDVSTQFGEFAVAWVGLLNAETGDVTPIAASGADLAHWPFPLVNIHEDQFKNGLITTAIHTAQVVTSEDIAADERLRNLQSSFIKEDLHATAIIPFQLRGVTIGVVTLISHEADLFKAQEEMLLLKEMGGDISFALDTMETEAERKQAENKLRENISKLDLAMQSANMAWWEMNIATGDVTFDNRKAEMLGYPPEKFKHYNDFMALVHPEDSDKAMNAMQKHIDGISDKYEVEYRILTKSEGYKWFYDIGSIVKKDSKGRPLNATGLVIDITDRKLAEARILQLNRLYSTLSQINQAIVRTHDREHLFKEICRVAIDFGKYRMAWIGLVNETTWAVEPFVFAGEEQGYLSNVQIKYLDEELGHGPTGTAIREGRCVISQDIATDPIMKPWREQALKHGYRSSASVPFWVKKHAIGSLTVYAEDPHTFDLESEKLLNEIGENISFALDTMETEGERKKAVEALRAKHELFQKTFNISPLSSILTKLPERTIIEVNPAFEELVGYARAEIIGKPVNEIDLWADPSERQRVADMLLKDGKVKDQEFIFKTKSGKTGHGIFYSEMIEQLEEKYILTKVMDITERKQAQEQQSKLTERLDLATHAAQMGTWDWNIQKNELVWDDRMYALYGTKPGDFGGAYEAWLNGVHPDDREPSNEVTQQTLHGGKEYDTEFRVLWPDGSVHWLKSNGQIFRDEAGNPLRMVGVNYDITERKQADAKIQRQMRHLNGLRIIDQAISGNLNMPETLNIIVLQSIEQLGVDAAAILLIDDQRQWLECAASQGFRSEEVHHARVKLSEGYAGRAARERQTIHIPNLPESNSSLAESLKTAGDDLLDYYSTPLIVKDEVQGVLEVYALATINPDDDWRAFFEMIAGQSAIAIENARLLEGLQRSNAELEQRVKLRTSDLLRVNAELEHANRTKDEFLANMSHELRTPLTGILGFAEVMQLNTYGQINEKQIKALQHIESSGRHLLELINDILDLSKIEAGKFDIHPEMISLEDTCRASMMFVKEQAQKKSVHLEYRPAENIRSAFVDPRRMKQMLVNLLSNAVKFTPEKGTVTLAVRADFEKGQIHFSVTDTGIGIAPEDLERLFTPFTQVDSRLNRQYEGTGLGLVLVLRLAEMHGGNVQVTSEVGKGSCFTVSLPWQQQSITLTETPKEKGHIQVSEGDTPNSRGVLLMAEDNAANIEVMGDYLQFKGYTLVLAANGVDALVKAEECNPRLILMDIQMPVMDGLEATRRLRADPRFASTPIIALTALAMTGDRERCLAAGANDYLSKPVILKELLKKIGDLLEQDKQDLSD